MELDGEKIITCVERGEIRLIRLCYDSKSGNPFFQYFLGFTLFSLGVIGLFVILIAFIGGTLRIHNDSGEPVIPLIPVTLWVMVGAGLWLLAGIFRARYHLVIETEKRREKVFFDRTARSEEVRQFIGRMQMNFGYEIDASILDKASAAS